MNPIFRGRFAPENGVILSQIGHCIMDEPLVFMAGFLADARLYGPQLTELGLERTVIHVPLVGDSVEDMAGHALQSLPARFALTGHSLGGMVAMEILRTAPDRVTRIALMDTNAQAETPSAAAAREARIVGAKAGRLAESLAEELRPDGLADSPDRDDIYRLWFQMGLDQGAENFVRQSRAMQRRPDQQPHLRRARLPALLLCGAEDRITPPRRHEFVAALMLRADLALIEGAGHVPMLERPDLVTAALREWLARPVDQVP